MIMLETAQRLAHHANAISIQSADIPMPTAGDDGLAITYDHITGSFTYSSVGSGGGSIGGNSFQIDCSDGTGDTYGVLSGAVDGSNTVFTTSLGAYVSASLQVYLNGQFQTQGTGEDWVETTPASGTFTFATAPEVGDIIMIVYQFSTSESGNADTLDGYHASDFIRAGNSFQIDQSGGTSDTYGVLSGSVDGSNTTFTVSLGSYVSGSLSVYRNGVLQIQGSAEGWEETTPASGTFDFITAPETGDEIFVEYQYTSSAGGNADTLDGSHLYEIIDTIYPVGSIYTSVVSTNPNTLFGRGTWTAFGAGKVLVGLDSGDADFDTVEETGGSKTHTLTVAEMPEHKHGQKTAIAAWSAPGTYRNNLTSNSEWNANDTNQINNAGGGGAHNNVQPYIVVYMWKRTA